MKEVIEQGGQIISEVEDMLTILTPQRVRKYVNKAYADFFGHKANELIGQKITDLFSEEKKRNYQAFTAGMTRENPSINTVQKSGPPHRERWVHWTENGVYDENGNLVEIVSVGRDVDEKVRSKMHRDDATNLIIAYSDAVNSNVICSITDTNGVITYVNKHFCEVSKYTMSELMGKSHNIINSGHHPKSFFTEMWREILEGNMWHGEIKNKAKDGSYYWVKTVIVPVRNSEKKLSSFLSLRILITEKKLLEEERDRYHTSLEDLIYMVSHELRSPIVNCSGVLDILGTYMPENEEYQRMLQYMGDSIDKLDSYSRKMNDYLQLNKNRHLL